MNIQLIDLIYEMFYTFINQALSVLVFCCQSEGSGTGCSFAIGFIRMATSALLEFERPVRPSSDSALLMSGPPAMRPESGCAGTTFPIQTLYLELYVSLGLPFNVYR